MERLTTGFSATQSDSLSSSTSSTSSANGNISTVSAPPGTNMPSKTESTAAVTTPTSVVATEADSNSQDELKAEIQRLKEQLRKKDETIHQQNVQLHYTAGGGGVSVVARPVVQQTPVVPANIGNGGVVVAKTSQYSTPHGVPSQVPPTYANLPQTTPSYVVPQTTPSYVGTAQYSNKQIRAAAALAASIVHQQGPQSAGGAGGYYSAPPQPNLPQPATTRAQQWSGPQTGVTPYQPAHTLVQLPAQPNTARQPAFMVSVVEHTCCVVLVIIS